jgi:phage protein D
LVSQKYLLEEDIETCVDIAAARYDAVAQTEEAEIDHLTRLTVEGN